MMVKKIFTWAALAALIIAVPLVFAAEQFPLYAVRGTGYVLLYDSGGYIFGVGNANPTIQGSSGTGHPIPNTALFYRTDLGTFYSPSAGSWAVASIAGQTLTGTVAGSATYTTPTLTNPVINSAMVAGGSALTLTAASHDGKTVALDTAAGTTITLPAATGSGMHFCFLVTVAATSNQHRINVVGNDAFFGGITQGNDTDNTTVTWPAGADADQINMNGTATGGTKGAVYCITDMVTDGWYVWGNSDASGIEATPFATGQVS